MVELPKYLLQSMSRLTSLTFTCVIDAPVDAMMLRSLASLKKLTLTPHQPCSRGSRWSLAYLSALREDLPGVEIELELPAESMSFEWD